jgi:hypothetical protein
MDRKVSNSRKSPIIKNSTIARTKYIQNKIIIGMIIIAAVVTLIAFAGPRGLTSMHNASSKGSISPVFDFQAATANAKFSNGESVVILYISTLWGTPTDTVYDGQVAVGTKGTIIAQPQFDTNTGLWYYDISLTTGQKGWIKETQLGLSSASTSTSSSTTSASTTILSACQYQSTGGADGSGWWCFTVPSSMNGDDLASIAVHFGVCFSTLASDNGFSSNVNVYTTKILKIPNKPGCQSSTTSTTIGTTTTTISSSQHLQFAIYTTNSTLIPEYKKYFGNGWKGILIDDAYSPVYRAYVKNWNYPQQFPRLLTADNYSQLVSTALNVGSGSDLAMAKVYNFGSNDYFAYDDEGWSKTPSWEQSDQQYWVTQFCNAVHSAGYKCGWTPQLGGWSGEGQWETINWSVVDYVELQEQGRTGSQSSLVQNVTHLAGIVRRGSQNTLIFVDLSMKYGVQNVTVDINALSQINGVDGVLITYLPSGPNGICSASQCNTNNLNSSITTIVTTSANP